MTNIEAKNLVGSCMLYLSIVNKLYEIIWTYSKLIIIKNCAILIIQHKPCPVSPTKKFERGYSFSLEQKKLLRVQGVNSFWSTVYWNKYVSWAGREKYFE